ncbi:MAG: JAB domain-containing protein, partial [Lachnospiraceae bacterium]|nr:JAB domain-containing protein [Lachnospiraceae bacterium]
MQADFMDVRLDDKKLPYAVHKAVGEYVGDQGIRIKNPQTAVKVLNEMFHMKDFAEERVYLILMSGSCDVISFAEISKGVLNCALLGVREILQRALFCNAGRLIVAHNHPGLGSTPCPSGSDIDLTGSLMRACRLMQVTFSDHIIIAGEQYFSFQEEWN